MITKSIFCLAIFATIFLSEAANLDEQNLNVDDELNPLQDQQQHDPQTKDQDKRTIFTPTVQNYGWAKHYGVNSAGHKYVIGYSPVDLKYVPVVKPIHHGYHYSKPKLHYVKPALHFKPVLQHQNDWKPIIVKPALPVNVPPIHLDHHHSVVETGHHHLVKPVVAPVVPAYRPGLVLDVPHHHHQQLIPIKPVVPIAPIYRPGVVLDPAHHHHHFKPVQFVNPVPVVPLPKPLPYPAYKPFIPSPALFEVQKPFGGVLQTPVLPPVLPPQFAHHPQYPPGTTVEYHGTHHFVPFHNHVVPAPVVPPHEQHDVQIPLVPANHPNFFHQQQVPLHFHQPLPHFHQQNIPVPHFHQHQIPIRQNLPPPSINQANFLQQDLPINQQPNFNNNNNQEIHHQQHLPLPINQANFLQQNLPINDQINFNQDFSSPAPPSDQDFTNTGQGFNFNGHQIIQPGQTDVQIPLHLPQHHFSSSGGGSIASGEGSVYKPSISLEPPFINKRKDDEK